MFAREGGLSHNFEGGLSRNSKGGLSRVFSMLLVHLCFNTLGVGFCASLCFALPWSLLTINVHILAMS